MDDPTNRGPLKNRGKSHRKPIIRVGHCRVIAVTGGCCERVGGKDKIPGQYWEIRIQYIPRRFPGLIAPSTLLTPRQAAAKLGISYPALKHWILAGRIKTVKTPGGHHRVPMEALEEFMPGGGSTPSSSPRISGRNQLQGTVMEVTVDGLLAKVVLAVAGQRVTAIITADAVKDLALKPGDTAIALIKATEVMVARP